MELGHSWDVSVIDIWAYNDRPHGAMTYPEWAMGWLNRTLNNLILKSRSLIRWTISKSMILIILVTKLRLIVSMVSRGHAYELEVGLLLVSYSRKLFFPLII